MEEVSQIYYAPIQGVTNYTFRNCYNRHFKGIDRFYAPYILVKNCNSIKNGKFKDVLPVNNDVPALMPQLMSNEADDFIILTEMLLELGYDRVNWNLGCPFPMVARKKRGSGLLPEYERIDSILDMVCAKYPGKVSIKMRLGRETKEDIFKLLPIFNSYPLEEIIIHPRTGVQMYEGVVDPDSFARCLEISTHEVVYNGDIFSYADYLKFKERFPSVKKWMLARGVLSNPFLPEFIKLGESTDYKGQVERIRRFHDDLFDSYILLLSSPRHVCDKMKEVWSYLSLFFTDGDSFFKKLKRVKTVEDYVTVITLFLEKEAASKETILGAMGC